MLSSAVFRYMTETDEVRGREPAERKEKEKEIKGATTQAISICLLQLRA